MKETSQHELQQRVLLFGAIRLATAVKAHRDAATTGDHQIDPTGPDRTPV